MAGLVGSLIATLVHGAVDNSFFLPDLAALWWTTYALLGMLSAEAGTRTGGLARQSEGCHASCTVTPSATATQTPTETGTATATATATATP